MVLQGNGHSSLSALILVPPLPPSSVSHCFPWPFITWTHVYSLMASADAERWARGNRFSYPLPAYFSHHPDDHAHAQLNQSISA